jgi:hypothetical protein
VPAGDAAPTVGRDGAREVHHSELRDALPEAPSNEVHSGELVGGHFVPDAGTRLVVQRVVRLSGLQREEAVLATDPAALARIAVAEPLVEGATASMTLRWTAKLAPTGKSVPGMGMGMGPSWGL